eukprot:1482825-Amphidinium_carterae.1
MFSSGNGIYYQFSTSTIFLKLMSGVFNMLVDAAWFITLLSISLWRIHLLWTAFVHSTFMNHILDLFNVWETVIVMFGWGNCVGFFVMWSWLNEVVDAWKGVRDLDP